MSYAIEFDKEFKGKKIVVEIENCYNARITSGGETHGSVSYSSWYPVRLNNRVLISRPEKIGLPKKAVIGIPENIQAELLESVEMTASGIIEDLKSGKRTIDLKRIGHDTQLPHLEIQDLPKDGPLSSSAIIDRMGANPRFLSRDTLFSCGRDDRVDVTAEMILAVGGQKITERTKKEKRDIEILFASVLAKRSGKNVEIARWDEFDSNENCVVNCYEYVTPEGEKTTERILTY